MKEIQLTQEKVAIVDDEDFDRVNEFNWYAAEGERTFYAQRQTQLNYEKKTYHMHKFVLNTEERIDHINGNGLDNRKENLRVATNQQNCMNVAPKHSNKTSKYKGVYKASKTTFEVQIKINYKSYNLGRLKDEELAAKYYDAVARYYYGEFAWCNFNEVFIEPRPLEVLKAEIKKLRESKSIKTISIKR